MEVLLNTKVVDFDGEKVTLGDGTSIETRTMIDSGRTRR